MSSSNVRVAVGSWTLQTVILVLMQRSDVLHTECRYSKCGFAVAWIKCWREDLPGLLQGDVNTAPFLLVMDCDKCFASFWAVMVLSYHLNKRQLVGSKLNIHQAWTAENYFLSLPGCCHSLWCEVHANIPVLQEWKKGRLCFFGTGAGKLNCERKLGMLNYIVCFLLIMNLGHHWHWDTLECKQVHLSARANIMWTSS